MAATNQASAAVVGEIGDASVERDLPAPGTMLHYDFREGPVASASSPSSESVTDVKVVQWNIERNYKLEEIIELLQCMDADIIALQEVDIFCERSRRKNGALEIAKALKMKAAFICEFEEVYSEMRNGLTQGGGIHGNMLLSKFDFTARGLNHRHHPFNWERDGHLVNEPRKGSRSSLVGVFDTPIGDIVCYNSHLEVFSGILGRVEQFADILDDSAQMSSKHSQQIICGDLNTMAHSIARLSSRYCRDQMRWYSLGLTEAEWWEKFVLHPDLALNGHHTHTHSHGDKTLHSHSHDHSRDHSRDESSSSNSDNGSSSSSSSPAKAETESLRNHFLEVWGVSDFAVEKAINIDPVHAFRDPFDAYYDITITKFGGLFSGKLDWILVKALEVVPDSLIIDNHNYNASDHKLLALRVRKESHPGSSQQSILRIRQQRREQARLRELTRWIRWSTVATVVAAGLWALLGLRRGGIVGKWLVAPISHAHRFLFR